MGMGTVLRPLWQRPILPRRRGRKARSAVVKPVFTFRMRLLESEVAAMSPKPKALRPTRRSRPRVKPVRPPLRGRKPVGPGHTQALSRGLAILDALAAAPGGATLTAVAERVSLPAPTVHRLLATLEQDRYVALGAGGAWRVGVRA